MRNGYEDVEEIADPDGVVAVISRRRSNGILSIAIFKVFERDGNTERTNFFNARHLPAVRRVLEIAEQRLAVVDASSPAKPAPASPKSRAR